MVKHYGMFTDEGNKVIQNIVDLARAADLSWKEVYFILEHEYKHGKVSGKHTECMDTVVRESVYNELGFVEKNQDFYF